MGRTLDRRSGLTMISLGIILLLLALLGARLFSDPAWRAYLGAIGTALLVLGAPPVLFPATDLRDILNQPISSWYFLLSEPGSGYSLSRVQFLIWFLPAFAIWVGACIKAGDLIPLTTQWLTLLGLAGSTSVLGTLTSQGQTQTSPQTQAPPPTGGGETATTTTTAPATNASLIASLSQAAAGDQGQDQGAKLAEVQRLLQQYSAQTAAAQAAPAAAADPKVDPAIASAALILPPSLRDLIEDWDGRGDVTRYQYLLLSFFLAASLVVIFWQGRGELPAINENLWPFVAASSGSYLGTKFVKQIWSKS